MHIFPSVPDRETSWIPWTYLHLCVAKSRSLLPWLMSMAPPPTPLQLPSILVEVSLSKSQTQLSSSSTVRALPYLYTLACVQENTLIAILLRWGLLMCVKVNLFLTHGWIVQPSLCIYCVGVLWSSQSSSSVWVYSGLYTYICTPL